MKGQNPRQLGNVLDEGLNGSRRKLGEGFISGGEDGEGARALEGFDEVGRADGGDEGAEGGVADGDFYDVWHGFWWGVGLTE